MKIILPHFPSKLDVRIGSFLKDLIVIHPYCWPIKIRQMNKSDLRSKNEPIDFKSIFGIVRAGNLQLLENFVTENDPNCLKDLDTDGFTLMHYAAYEGFFHIVNYLYENNSILDDHSNKNGQKPIHWACIKGRTDIVAYFLSKGVDINFQDKRGNTPLITACQSGHQGLVAFLVGKGAKLDIEDTNGDTCLHWAAYKGFPDLTRLLIVYGAYPKKIDAHSQTVLHMACLGGNLNIVQQLVDQDCIDTEIRDENGRKAIDLARARYYNEIVDFLDRHEKKRKNKYCNLKTLFFGPVGNSRIVFLILHILYFFYQYPLYFYRVLPETWSDYKWTNTFYLINNVMFWLSLYAVHLKEPGYLKKNTEEYQQMLKTITFRTQNSSPSEWNESLARLCHTCKAVKPLRASHCRMCNRCVLAYDHHCPYVQNCIGYNNRPWFFLFVFLTATLQIITTRVIYLMLSVDFYQYIFWPGTLIVVLFGFMVIVLTFGAFMGAVHNLTTNEISKRKKYAYLQTNINGTKKSLFDKGCVYNLKYYFHLVDPSNLETESYEAPRDYTV